MDPWIDRFLEGVVTWIFLTMASAVSSLGRFISTILP